MLRCKDLSAELDAYLDGELEEERAAEVARHVEECPACRQALAERRGVALAVKRLPGVKAPAGFAERFRAARQAEPAMARPHRPRMRRRLAWMAGSAAAAAAALLIAAVMLPAALAPHRAMDAESQAPGAAGEADDGAGTKGEGEAPPKRSAEKKEPPAAEGHPPAPKKTTRSKGGAGGRPSIGGPSGAPRPVVAPPPPPPSKALPPTPVPLPARVDPSPTPPPTRTRVPPGPSKAPKIVGAAPGGADKPLAGKQRGVRVYFLQAGGGEPQPTRKALADYQRALADYRKALKRPPEAGGGSRAAEDRLLALRKRIATCERAMKPPAPGAGGGERSARRRALVLPSESAASAEVRLARMAGSLGGGRIDIRAPRPAAGVRKPAGGPTVAAGKESPEAPGFGIMKVDPGRSPAAPKPAVHRRGVDAGPAGAGRTLMLYLPEDQLETFARALAEWSGAAGGKGGKLKGRKGVLEELRARGCLKADKTNLIPAPPGAAKGGKRYVLVVIRLGEEPPAAAK